MTKLLLVAGVLAALSAPVHAADEPAGGPGTAFGPFAKAIEYAQARTVKIYGGSIGRSVGYASGIIVSPDGRILAAQGSYLAAEQLRVELPDGALHTAAVERRSEELQAVVLKIDAPTPHYFELPDEPVAQKGDWVIGISNLFKVATGSEPLSASLGIVSLRTRIDGKRGTQDIPYEGDVLLIDAITSNPGAPGGAVVTADGKLAGMIGKIMESKDTQTRVNYAVPSDLLARFLAGRPLTTSPHEAPAGQKGEVGIRLFALAGTSGPAYIDRVVPNSPAHKAGLKADDLILSVGGQKIGSVRDYKAAEATLIAGKPVEFLVKRKNELIRVEITPQAE